MAIIVLDSCLYLTKAIVSLPLILHATVYSFQELCLWVKDFYLLSTFIFMHFNTIMHWSKSYKWAKDKSFFAIKIIIYFLQTFVWHNILAYLSLIFNVLIVYFILMLHVFLEYQTIYFDNKMVVIRQKNVETISRVVLLVISTYYRS